MTPPHHTDPHLLTFPPLKPYKRIPALRLNKYAAWVVAVSLLLYGVGMTVGWFLGQ